MRALLGVLLAVSALASTKAGQLLNLGFEEAATNNVQFFTDLGGRVYGVGTIGDLLPGWKVFQGTNELSTILYKRAPIDGGDITVLLKDESGGSFGDVREGNYDLLIGGTIKPLTLRQTGEIPADAGYLMFRQFPFLFTPMVNGQVLPIASADIPAPYHVQYLIAPYAGQTVDLDFVIGPASLPSAEIDDIRFLPIPEPSAFGLLVFGGLLLGGHVSRQLRRVDRASQRSWKPFDPGGGKSPKGATSPAP